MEHIKRLNQTPLFFFGVLFLSLTPTIEVYGGAPGPLFSPTMAVINFDRKLSEGPLLTPPPTKKKGSPTAITVMPFVPQEGESKSWLSKGLADMLIRDLSEVQSLAILERDKMQTFVSEIELEKSPLFSKTKALQIGRVSKVEEVLYGNYAIKDEKITISIFLLDMASQEIKQTESIEGDISDLRRLTKKLVFQFLKKKGVHVSKVEEAHIQYNETESLDATAHFYKGLDHYDRGEPTDAFGEFFAATKKDNNFMEAHLWMGKMFESLDYPRHAEVMYRSLFMRDQGSVEGRDALYLSGRILELKLKEMDRAITTYRILTRLDPPSPHALEAAYRLGQLYEQKQDDKNSYRYYQFVDAFREKIHNNPDWDYKTKMRQSHVLNWDHALNLYHDSIVKLGSLTQSLLNQGSDLSPPRGVFVLDPKNPILRENKFGKTPSLFFQAHDAQFWQEELYVVIAPPGMTFTGIDLEVTGKLETPKPFYSYDIQVFPFPLSGNPSRGWLGTIFGQTAEMKTLKKTIFFHGENRSILTIKLLRNHGKIKSWAIKGHLKETGSQPPRKNRLDLKKDDQFWEGKIVARLPFPQKSPTQATRPYIQTYLRPDKEMTMVRLGSGDVHLVTTMGELDGEQTHMWESVGSPNGEWSPLKPLPINSASEDFNPKLVRSEGGSLRLFWISTRRGRGWELWSSIKKQKSPWNSPKRIPLEKFIDPGFEKKLSKISHILEYDVIQDHKGRWLLTYYSPATKEVVFLRSQAGRPWNLEAHIPTKEPFYGLALLEDQSLKYRLAALSPSGGVHLWSSNNAQTWANETYRAQFWNDRSFGTSAVHRMHLFPSGRKEILMILSDNFFGVQFAKFNPDFEKPKFDLVTRALLDPYTITPDGKGRYFLALKKGEEIEIRHYDKFTIGDQVQNDTRNWPIYIEVEHDKFGTRWNRIFAHRRMVVPDVTTVGVESSGRVWWGIESGIMFKDEDKCFATDVSLGFFHHFITNIACCPGSQNWFSSDTLDKPILGTLENPHTRFNLSSRPQFRSKRVPGVKGAITATTCGKNPNDVFIGTSKGAVALFNGEETSLNETFDQDQFVTALAYQSEENILWVGTKNHGLYKLEKGNLKNVSLNTKKPTQNVLALTIDRKGSLWASFRGLGLARLKNGKWNFYTPLSDGILYDEIGSLTRDPQKGIWYLPSGHVQSRGLGYFDGKNSLVYNPPHRLLEKPSSLGIDQQGHVWVGTWFDGLYEIIPKGVQ